jgi:hypothetical protein
MDAAHVWAVWRRILREPELHTRMFAPGFDPRRLGLDDSDAEVVRAYSTSPAGVRFFVASYRYRMVSSFVNALETVAPLTHRALRAREVDIDRLAREFFDATGWLDHGPYVVGFAAAILDQLAFRAEVVAVPGMRDLIRLEQAGADVLRQAAGSEPSVPDLVNPWLRIVRCDRDVSGWLRVPSDLGRSVPPNGPRPFAVHLPALDRPYRIAALSESGVELLERLRRPGAAVDDSVLLQRFRRAGLVRPEAR